MSISRTDQKKTSNNSFESKEETITILPLEISDSVKSDFFPSFTPLEPLLNYLTSKESNSIEESLFNNVNTLQEYFLETLYKELADIDTQHKISLKLDESDNLILFEDHPCKGKINERLESNQSLSTIFSQISLYASALRDLRRLKHIAHEGNLEEGSPFYRISLKGDMNHFYFYG